MHPMRRELFRLAEHMPDSTLRVACMTLQAVKTMQDAMDQESAEGGQRTRGANVVYIGRHPGWQSRRNTGRTNTQHPAENPAQEPTSRSSRHVRAGTRRIEDLERHIERLRAAGHPTEAAEDLLATFRQSLHLMKRHVALERRAGTAS